MTNEMYWEDLYEMYEYASNMDMIELNEQMKFQYLLHAQTKDALNNWKDLPIPYPRKGWKPPRLSMNKTFKRFSKTEKADSKQKKRFKEILERMKNQK